MATAGLCVLLLSTGTAFAARGWVFSKPFGGPGSGAGEELNHPTGVAVNEATGDVYVIDKGNYRVDVFNSSGVFQSAFGWDVVESGPDSKGEQQLVTVTATGGNFTLTYAGQTTGATGTGTLTTSGTLTQRRTVTSVVTSTGAFNVGESISGTGIAAGTTILAVGSGTLTLSAAATASGTLVALTAAIPYNAAAATLQTALTALSTIGGAGGTVTVTGGPGNSSGSKPYDVTFGGTLGKASESLMTASPTNLTGGAKTATVTFHGFEVCDVAAHPTDVCKAGALGSGEGQFSSPESIAVDNSCTVQRPVLTVSTKPTCQEFDPSYGDVYVVNAGFEVVNNVVDKFSEAGAYVGKISESPTLIFKLGTTETELSSPVPFEETRAGQGLYGAAVDATGGLWIYLQHHEGPLEVDDFSHAKANLFVGARRLSGFGQTGIGVDSEDNLYAATDTGTVKFDSQGKELLYAALDSEPSGGIFVEPLSDDVYIDNLTSIARFGPDGSLLERFGSLTAGSGVAVDRQGKSLYVAESSNDVIDLFTPEPPGEPLVMGESASHVTSDGATLAAQVEPRTEPGEAEPDTIYYVEYGTVKCSANPGACARLPESGGVDVGSGFDAESVSVDAQGLSPDTEYFFRFVASNRHGTPVAGEELTFTTQSAGAGFALPDGRSWEMVSPPDAGSASFEPMRERGGLIEASESGQALTYTSVAATEASPQGEPTPDMVQIVSRRGPGGGWSSQDVATPHEAMMGGGNLNGEYGLFSSDLSRALVEPLGFTLLSPLRASERTPYLREEARCQTAPEECYLPLVTGKSGYANVPEGTQFGNSEGGAFGEGDVKFVSATSDLNHIVLESKVPLVAGASGAGLYEWTAGMPPAEQLQLVSVLPGPSPKQTACARVGDNGENLTGVVRDAISNGGSSVIWEGEENQSECENNHRHLYVRDITVHGVTTQLDAVQSGAPGTGVVKPVYQIASVNGSRVFFTDIQELTSQSTGGDLYAYEGGQLEDLTVPVNAGEHADVLGVPGASEEGTTVYVVATSVLTNKPDAAKETAKAGADNLYVLVRNDGKWEEPQLVAVLSSEDAHDWPAGFTLSKLTSRVSPNGNFFAFMSNHSLTGYDNRDANSGVPDEEVFLFDASTKDTVCASCHPTGERPSGVRIVGEGENGFHGYPLVDLPQLWTKRWIAGLIPGWTPTGLGFALYQSRYLSNEGRLFFDSPDALSPHDPNGTWDVYEYEPEGVGRVGGCTTESASFSRRSGGCIGLISSGTSNEESVFLDASGRGPGGEEGEDVFFLTAAKLVPADVNTSREVYDAHVCSTAAPCGSGTALPPPCTTAEACRAAPSPQPSVFGAPLSATFSGAGNVAPPVGKPSTAPLTRAQKLSKALKACHKKKSKRKRAACERQARKSYGAKVSGAGKPRTASASKRGRR